MKFLPLVFLVFSACGGTDPGSGSDPAGAVGQTQESRQAPHGQAVLDQATLDKLVAADALDGSKDHVISKCAGCALAMDGSPDHALKLADTTLRFCSTFCRDEFGKDPAARLARLEIPEQP